MAKESEILSVQIKNEKNYKIKFAILNAGFEIMIDQVMVIDSGTLSDRIVELKKIFS